MVAIAKTNPDDRPVLAEQLRQSRLMSDKAPVLAEQQASIEIEPSSVTDDEAQPKPEESEFPTCPMAEIQKIPATPSGIKTVEELADESTMFYELEDAVSTVIHRCLRYSESYPDPLDKKSYRRKVPKIFKEAIQFTNKIEQEEPT